MGGGGAMTGAGGYGAGGRRRWLRAEQIQPPCRSRHVRYARHCRCADGACCCCCAWRRRGLPLLLLPRRCLLLLRPAAAAALDDAVTTFDNGEKKKPQ